MFECVEVQKVEVGLLADEIPRMNIKIISFYYFSSDLY